MGTIRGAAIRDTITAFITGDAATLASLVTDDVVVWTPNLSVASKDELLASIGVWDQGVTNVNVQIDAVDVFGSKAFAEFRITGTFSDPIVLAEDVVIEPTGGTILVGAAGVAEFTGNHIKALRLYFDDAALLEQLLPV